MTLVIDLSPELEKKLQEAAERRQLPPVEYARAVIEDCLKSEPEAEPFWKTATPEEWEREFRAWADSHDGLPVLSDEALTRESIYGHRA
jgi:predicted transcriptional regulator